MQALVRLFCLTFFLLGNLHLIASEILLSEQIDIDILTEVEFLTDSAGDLSLENIVQNPEKNSFKPLKEDSYQKSKNTYWLRFKLSQTSSHNGDWLLDFQYWSYVDFYYRNGDKWEVKKTGRLFPFAQRDYPVANKCYIHLPLENGEEVECLVRLESCSKEGVISGNLGFEIHDRTSEDKWNITVGLVIAAFLGIFLVMFFYNLFIYLSTRLRSYAYYLIVVLFTIYHTSYNAGYLISMFGTFDSFPYYLQFFYEPVSSALYGFSILLFVQEFLKVSERYPRWNKAVNILKWTALVSAVLIYVHYDIGNVLGGLFAFAMIIVIITLAIKSVRDKYPSSVYFLLGYAAFLFSLLLVVLAITGAIPLSDEILNFAVPGGATVQIVLFSLALANMINVLRHENEQKQLRIIAQLEENQVLQTKVNRELEEKVKERTSEINKQKEQITLQKEAIEKEKEKSDELLLNILPESTATELKENGFSKPKVYDNVSVLFTDFVRFTNIGEKLGPADLVQELDHCFRAFDEIIYNNKLEKIKTIGDSYMAAGGVPVIEKDNAVHAVKAALEIRDFINEWNEEKKAKGLTPWEIRIGINNGPITAGVVGKKKFAFDIWGDTVNVASRMESNSVPGHVNISKATYEMIKDAFTCTVQRND